MTSVTTDRRFGLNSGVAIKAPCDLATTANITLSGEQSIDGTTTSASRVFVKNQTTTANNGIYRSSTGTWVREPDFNGNRDVVSGTIITVFGGSTLTDTMWRVTNTGTITIGTTGLTFERAVVNDSTSVSFLQAGTGAVTRTMQHKERDWVSAKDFGCVGDGVTDDRAAMLVAMAQAVSLVKTLYIPDGTYAFSNWMPLPSTLQMVFAPGAIWKLTTATGAVGSFLIGGYDINLAVVAFDDVEIHGIALDCNNIAGENGFSAVRGENVRLFNPKIYNTVHSTTRLGGRAFQFESNVLDGIHIYSPYMENCSIGINSQGSPAGTPVARNINYYDVVMRDVDIPFNIDSQYASPETNTLHTMSTFVHGAELYNCGRISWAGDTSAGLGGGIVCGDRGHGLKISGMRIINTAAYGAIGGLTRGVMFNVHLSDVQMLVTTATALFDFTLLGWGAPSSSSFPSTVFTENISFKGNLDYLIKGGASNDRIGASRFAGIEIDGATASLTGIMDANAGTGTSGTSAFLELILSDQSFKTTFLQSLAQLYTNGNTTAQCLTPYQEGTWTPVDGSGAGLAFTITGTSKYSRRGRLVTANCAITYPATANGANATIGGLPFTATNDSGMAGVGSIGYRTEATLSSAYVIGNTTTALLTTSAGVALLNSAMSTDSVYLTFTYFA